MTHQQYHALAKHCFNESAVQRSFGNKYKARALYDDYRFYMEKGKAAAPTLSAWRRTVQGLDQ